MATERLNVIALVSGGKDSFFSALHCQANGHRIVALANLHPPETQASATLTASVVPGSRQHDPSADHSDDGHELASGQEEEEDEADLNSFMYQTVGHQVIPLYAEATGIPLFRQPIVGTTIQSGISYRDPRQLPSRSTSTSKASDALESGPGPRSDMTGDLVPEDETESLVPLLRAVIAAHPEANALCTGAILSTYQRTRIESVALRLGLVPLAYLWQYPVLPIPNLSAPGSLAYQPSIVPGTDDDAQLLRDMAAVGLEAQIIKVASAGLDEDFLWENVASERSITRMKRALRRFGGGGRGSVLGEGGEFETLVIDGPPALFKGRIVVRDADRRVVREGGGSTWLSIREAHVETKTALSEAEDRPGVRIPELLEPRFRHVLSELQAGNLPPHDTRSDTITHMGRLNPKQSTTTLQHDFIGVGEELPVEKQTAILVEEIRKIVEPGLITNTVIVLRQMSDFPTVNKIYGALFSDPNPPSRVTISCGDLLPEGSKIAVFVTAQPGLTSSTRQGLHVQSRSYWAPANIGPYSQAIVFPQGAPQDKPTHADRSAIPQVVTIAGQIPLIPASMDLPTGQGSELIQVTMALQHLWRVGLEMQTQWWSSAVAYFPRTSAEEDMRQKALLASRAWRSAHLCSTGSRDEDDDENGPDLWDRKYNPQYMSLTGNDESAAAPMLPAWGTLNDFDEDNDNDEQSQRSLPYVFAAEVEELPRAAGVEWHAHRGLVKVSPGSVYVATSTQNMTNFAASLELQHVVVDSADEVYIHTIAAISLEQAESAIDLDAIIEGVSGEAKTSIAAMMESRSPSQLELLPYLTYVDAQRVSYSQRMSGANGSKAIIPCRTLWDAQGQRLHSVMVYQMHFTKIN